MGPSRTPKHRARTSEAAGGEQRKHTSSNRQHDSAGPSLPGVQKIKAALRQTRRLLAKEKLAADVRVATERRQRALETDLANTERARKERAMAQRYHKVKFFERRKVSRKLKQVQRQLESCTDKKEKKKLEKALLELRVDLNYITHFPKLKKYISLFPPEVRQHAPDADTAAKGKAKEAEAEKAATDAQRKQVREEIRERMERGDLSTEPELEDRKAVVSRLLEGSTSQQDDTAAARKSGPAHVPDIGEDAFFGEDSGEDEGEGEGDDEGMESD